MEVDGKKATEIGNYINGPLLAGCLAFFLSNHLALKKNFVIHLTYHTKVLAAEKNKIAVL